MDTNHILHLEDNPLDADLVRSILTRALPGCAIDRVETREEFLSAIRDKTYQLILADYQLPAFDGLQALELVRSERDDPPVIILSGVLGEEVAVEALKRGATDYVVKTRMDRLVPAVRRALDEASEKEGHRRAEDRLRFALEAGRLGSWELDQSNNVFTCSDVFKQIHGRDPSLEFSLDDLFGSIHPDDLERLRLEITSAAEDQFEYRVIWPDGAIHWVLARGRMEARADGRTGRVSGVSLDITRRKQDEETARFRATQLQSLASVSVRVNAAHDVASIAGVVTSEGRRLINARIAVLNLGPDPETHAVPDAVSCSTQYDGWRVEEIATGMAGLAALVRKSNRVARRSRTEIEADPAWRGDGPMPEGPPLRGWVGIPLVGRNGRNLGVLQLADKELGEFDGDDESILVQLAQMAAVAVENARLYRELRENDRRKDEFLAMLAHELRNPLGAINNAVGLALRSQQREHVEWSLDVIGRQVRLLTRLIDDLLDVSRITQGKIELKMERLEASPVVASALQAVRTLIEERKHKLKVQVREGELYVVADPVRLEQMLTNLLTNAAKYTDYGGEIRLSAYRDNDSVFFEVLDNGAGIAPEALPQMFELFVQGDRTLARSEGGLGIGLTLVKRLAEMHGGEISASSGGAGKGSTFTIRLPAVPLRGIEGRSTGEGRRGALPESSSVLVVEDNVDAASALSRLLRLLGHKVWTVHDGLAAIEAARQNRPDYILLDIGLPGMDGYQVAERLRRQRPEFRPTIIALTGYGQEDDRRRSREAGFDHHLVKPIDHATLLGLLSPPSKTSEGGGGA